MNGRRRKGFTLIELLVVLAVLTILAAVAIPSFASIIDKSKLATDQANLVLLNKMTLAYAVHDNLSGDIFSRINDDTKRMQVLVDKKYLAEIINPQYTDAEYNWNVDSQKWLYSYYKISSDIGDNFSFVDLFVKDFRKSPINSFVNTINGFSSKSGLLFVDNPRDEYVLETNAKLGIGKSGGYGILIEASLTDTNLDTGYILQFDRGFGTGTVILRPRDNGTEGGAIKEIRFDSKKSNGVIADKTSPEGATWWESNHDVKMEVKKISGSDTQKNLSVWIDGKLLFNQYIFDTKVESANNFTGYRAWDNSGAEFSTLKISPLE